MQIRLLDIAQIEFDETIEYYNSRKGTGLSREKAILNRNNKTDLWRGNSYS